MRVREAAMAAGGRQSVGGRVERWRPAPGAAGEAAAPPTAPVDGPAPIGPRDARPIMSLLSVTGVL